MRETKSKQYNVAAIGHNVAVEEKNKQTNSS